MKYLIVVDMQNDFTTGSLGSAHAAAIIPNVVGKNKPSMDRSSSPETPMVRIIWMRSKVRSFQLSTVSKIPMAGRSAMN